MQDRPPWTASGVAAGTVRHHVCTPCSCCIRSPRRRPISCNVQRTDERRASGYFRWLSQRVQYAVGYVHSFPRWHGDMNTPT